MRTCWLITNHTVQYTERDLHFFFNLMFGEGRYFDVRKNDTHMLSMSDNYLIFSFGVKLINSFCHGA